MEGILRFAVWPAYVGVLDSRGYEPWSYSDYQRRQINWEMKDGIVLGQIAEPIYTPPGEFTHFAFTLHPTCPAIMAIESIDHPFVFMQEGEIMLREIAQDDFTTKAVLPGRVV